MAVYTVHEPPPRDDLAPDPARFQFVRDGFYFWAFLLAPLWMLRRRLGLVLLGYVVLMAAVGAALHLSRASTTVTVAVEVLIALLIGFEAASLRRFTLTRRGWRQVGVVVGDDMEAAERRFFDGWVRDEAQHIGPPPAVPPAAASVPTMRRPPSHPEVIGLFPEPGAPR